MNTIKEILRDADPLRYEPIPPVNHQAIVTAASAARVPSVAGSRFRIIVLTSVIVIAALFLVPHKRSLLVADLQAAVRFEVKLAEDSPASGLHEAKIVGSNRTIYLHDETIVTNSDIAHAQVIEGAGPSQFSIGVEFTSAGAQKMRSATASHIGKPIAILIDGEIVMAPVLKAQIDGSAVVTGNFTRAQAERIVNGITQ